MTPVEQARAVLEVEKTFDTLPTPEKAAARLRSHQHLRQSLFALMEFHNGYAQEHRQTGELVLKLLTETFSATNGELRWASELPVGKAPAFRRALNNLIAHFRTRKA